LPFTPDAEAYQELQTKYRCLACDLSGAKWCWIQEFKGMPKPYHAQLDNLHLDTWATHIVEKTATIFYPPRIPEFDNLILKPLLKKYKPQTSVSIVEPSIPPVNPGLLREVHYNYISENRHNKRHKDYNSDTPNSSPIKRRKRKDYDTSVSSSSSSDHSPLTSQTVPTLSPMHRWCKTEHCPEYPGWDEAFDILRHNDVGLDSFSKKMKSSKLIRLCHSSNLKEATAERLIKAHKKWMKSGKP
jgi:hypothetical protein